MNTFIGDLIYLLYRNEHYRLLINKHQFYKTDFIKKLDINDALYLIRNRLFNNLVVILITCSYVSLSSSGIIQVVILSIIRAI